jgi:hypothetical protein
VRYFKRTFESGHRSVDQEMVNLVIHDELPGGLSVVVFTESWVHAAKSRDIAAVTLVRNDDTERARVVASFHSAAK